MKSSPSSPSNGSHARRFYCRVLNAIIIKGVVLSQTRVYSPNVNTHYKLEQVAFYHWSASLKMNPTICILYKEKANKVKCSCMETF